MTTRNDTGKNIHAQMESEEVEEIIRDAHSNDWDKVKCVFCGKKISIYDAKNAGGDPACSRCY